MAQGERTALPWGAVVAWGAHVRAQGPWGGRAERQCSPTAAVPDAPRAPSPEPRTPSPEPRAGSRGWAAQGGARGSRRAARSRMCRTRGLRRRLGPARQLGVAAGQIGGCFPKGNGNLGRPKSSAGRGRAGGRGAAGEGGRWVLGWGRRVVWRRPRGRPAFLAEGPSADGPRRETAAARPPASAAGSDSACVQE